MTIVYFAAVAAFMLGWFARGLIESGKGHDDRR